MIIYGFKAESKTKELKSKIRDKAIRENVTKIYLYHDNEENADYLEIFFKPQTVKNTYEDTFMEQTSVKLHNNIEKDINEWLKEIAYCD